MKILHIAMGSPEFDRAALDLGHEVRRVNWRQVLGRRFTQGHVPALQKAIMDAARFGPDLVFVQTHQSDVIAPETYAALRDQGAFVVNWCGDVREPLPECYRHYADMVDVMAFSNMTDVEILRSEGLRSEYLQIGYDPDIYNRGTGHQERHGIVFMANHYAGRFPNSQLRHDVAMRLRDEFGADFTLYGSGWGIPGVRPTVNGYEEAEIYRRALVAINVDHFTRPHFASDRILRAQACGCEVVSMDYPNGVADHPTVRFTASIDGMVESVRFAMMNTTVGAHINVFNHHRWHNRIQQMTAWRLFA